MPFHPTPIPDLIVFEPQVWRDDRGYFFESYNQNVFRAAGIDNQFVQDNQARSTYGVLRGLHFQKGASAQAKLVRVLEGEVFDVAVDLRKDSPTCGQWYGIHLSAENKRQLFVPRGFAHGYLVLTPTAEFAYKCDNFYDKAAEGGLCYNDPAIGIEWPSVHGEYELSDRDQEWPAFGDESLF